MYLDVESKHCEAFTHLLQSESVSAAGMYVCTIKTNYLNILKRQPSRCLGLVEGMRCNAADKDVDHRCCVFGLRNH